MRKKILIAILFIVVSIAITQYGKTNEVESNNIEVLPVEPVVPVVKIDTNKNLSVKQILQTVPKKYGVNPKIVENVAFCESTLRYNAVGDGGHAYGILQFHKPTFLQFEKKYGEDLNYNSSYDQAKLASKMIKDGYGSHWTCYNKLYGA